MANNELFYRVAREALDDNSDTSIQELVDDLDAAVESYLQGVQDDEENDGNLPRYVKDEIKHGARHAAAFAHNLRAWEEN